MKLISERHHYCDTGFTLVEVLVGLLVIVGFISTAMQALVTATVFKVKGQELSEATTWIQEDIERVRFEAKRMGLGEDVNLAACQTLDNTSGYAALLQDRINQNAPVDTDKLSVIGKRPYNLTRTPTLSSDAPFNVLGLEYEVINADDIAIAVVQTKVIPDKSLECP